MGQAKIINAAKKPKNPETKKEDINLSPDNLKPTRSESIEEINISNIRHYNVIPDYREQSRLPYPVVVRESETVYHCIEGWRDIEEASHKGLSTIKCHVFHVDAITKESLALEKTKIRIAPQGGHACYAESMRNIFMVHSLLLDSDDMLAVNGHGGCRRGADFVNHKDDSLRSLISEYCCISKDSLNHYLSYGQYINIEAMQVLVAMGASRSFFENTNHLKSDKVKIIKGLGRTNNYITKIISNAYFSAFSGLNQSVDHRKCVDILSKQLDIACEKENLLWKIDHKEADPVFDPLPPTPDGEGDDTENNIRKVFIKNIINECTLTLADCSIDHFDMTLKSIVNRIARFYSEKNKKEEVAASG